LIEQIRLFMKFLFSYWSSYIQRSSWCLGCWKEIARVRCRTSKG